MSYSIRRSLIDPDLWEVCDATGIVLELGAPFQIRRVPRSFESIEAVKKWLQEMEKKLSKNYALYLLSRKSYASKALMDKLLQKRYSKSVVEAVLEEMERLGLIDDASFFERAIEQEFRKGKGPRYIAAKLRIDLARVREKITLSMQKEAVRKLLAKAGTKERSKVIAAILRRGFDFEALS